MFLSLINIIFFADAVTWNEYYDLDCCMYRTCEALSTALLNEAGVAVLPGTDFGAGGAGHIRISYVRNMEVLKEGMDRIEAYLAKQ